MTDPTAQPLDLDAIQARADDQAVRVLSISGAMCGVCGDEPGDRNCADCERVRRGYIGDLRAAGWAPQDEHEALVVEIHRLRAQMDEAREELTVAARVSEALLGRLSQEKLAGSALYAALTRPTTPEQRQAALDKFTAVAQQVSAPAAEDSVETHMVADDSDDPEHIDDCPGCDTGAPEHADIDTPTPPYDLPDSDWR